VRKPLIAGNWKMNKTGKEAVGLIEELKKGLSGNDVDIAVCPPFTALRDAADALKNTDVKLGAQNVFYEDAGAFTGEISAAMLRDLGVEMVILGHSERRGIFGETDQVINKKIKKVLKSGMVPILCVGETLEQRERGRTEEVVQRQVTNGLSGLTKEEIGSVVIAYEPVWAIGTGKSATAEEADRVIGYIRGILKGLADEGCADEIRILYGGSVKSGNAASLMGRPNIDGALVGGASLKADEFLGIIKHTMGREKS
jgi:triosephosphate isomerase